MITPTTPSTATLAEQAKARGEHVAAAMWRAAERAQAARERQRAGQRHPEADTTPVQVERSDAIDAAAGLMLLAREHVRRANARENYGPHLAGYRKQLREAARVYRAAAERVQRAADGVL